MSRPHKNNMTQLSCRIDRADKIRINEICQERGWVYGTGLPKLSELLSRIARSEVIMIDGKTFLLTPLDDGK
jgi:hypothetical protein